MAIVKHLGEVEDDNLTVDDTQASYSQNATISRTTVIGTGSTKISASMSDNSKGSFPAHIVYILLAVIVGLLVVITIAVFIVIYRSCRRKRHRENYSNNQPSQSSSGLLSPTSRHDLQMSPDGSRSRSDGGRSSLMRNRYSKVDVDTTQWVPQPGPNAQRHPPVQIDAMLDEFQTKEKDDDFLFKDEFNSIPRQYPQYSTKVMDATENSKKNRYPKNLVAVYDYNRVKLKSPDLNGNDYINANLVKQSDGKKQYIVCQAPMRNTQKDFWRMVWENDVSIIVMLCDLWRNDWELAYPYWPDENSPGRAHTYGQFRVTALKAQRYADHTVRHFVIEDMEALEEAPRTVYHFHFTAWRQGPESVLCKLPRVRSQITKFVDKVNQWEKRLNKDSSVPLVVHCSGGTAESGMYIALDQLKEQMQTERKIDLYNCVSHLRQQRPNAVHFPSQYKYVFETLLEQHLYGNTEVNISDLRNEVFRDATIQQVLNQQFEALNALPVPDRPRTVGLLQQNYKKNNYPSLIIPFDENRVPVSARHGQPFSSYINASWVDGYWEKQAYIVTQDPQHNTAAEFWRMVWEHHVTAVVMLTEPGPEPTQCYHYWPNDGESEVSFDNIVIQHEPNERIDCPGYSLRTFYVSNKLHEGEGSRDIYQFHYHEWPDGSTPRYATSLLDMIAKLRDSVPKTMPITIHCSGGGDRSSVFCAINLAMDQLKDVGKVDIPQTTRLLRHQRQYMIPTISEYEFLWKAVLQYIETYHWLDQDEEPVSIKV